MIDKEFTLMQLNEAYRILREDEDFEQVHDLLTNVVKINSLINYYMNAVLGFDSEDKKIIEMLVLILQFMYNNAGGESPIPDELYDKLYELNRDINQMEVVGSVNSITQERRVSAHKYPDLRGTLDKVHFLTNDEKKVKETRKSVEDWTKTSIAIAGSELFGNPEIELFPKWDGISGTFECNFHGDASKILKRGDTDLNEAEEMTELFKGSTNMKSLHPTGKSDFGVKTEIVMTRENFLRLGKEIREFKSPRSAVSSIVNSKELDKRYLEYLTVIPLQIQDFESKEIWIPESSYTVYPYETSRLFDYDDIANKIDIIAQRVLDEHGIDIDGVVFRIKNPHLQKALGREDNINKYEIAYKLPPAQKRTVLKDVEMSVGILGAITPVAKIEQVKLKGNTISSISLGSIDRFNTLQLRQGDTVVIKYDVIPYLDKPDDYVPSDGKLFTVPTHCPFCNEPLKKNPTLMCVNNNCDSRMIGKIMNYVTKMSISDISIGIITTLYRESILNSIADLYELDRHKRQIVSLSGFGSKSFQKILDGIKSRMEVYDYEFIGSLGIPGIGRRIFKKILDVYTLDELIDIARENNISKLTQIAGVKDVTALKITTGVVMNEDLIMYLRAKLKIKRDTRKYTIKVAFTKVRDKDFEKFLDSKDVLVMDSYNKNVDMLIVPSSTTTSSKVDKARKDNKEIVAISDAYKLFGYES